MSDFDTILWRPLQSGNEYEALFPKSKCQSSYVGTGNTDLSISEMEKVILQYAWQTEKVAPILERPTLEATTQAIHSFLFNHFQYKADDENQLLRSPACSWYTRNKGIDCKSYSILASCILLNLEITHYIRKIKQPGFAPTDFTHVYVIVPKDQKTGSLNNGYYLIDGTLKDNIEPPFIGKKDLYMSGLKHYALNAPFDDQTALNGSFSGLKNFSLKDVKSIKDFTRSLSCLGSQSYTQANLDRNLTAMSTYFNDLFEDMNNAVLQKNYTEFSTLVAEFKGIVALGIRSSRATLDKGWKSKCTENTIKAIIKHWEFYRDNVSKSLNIWLADSFNAVPSAFIPPVQLTDKEMWEVHKMEGVFRGNNSTTQVVSYVPKPNKTIKAFEITPYIADTNPASSNMIDVLESLGQVLVNNSANPNVGINPGGSYTVLDQDGNPINPDGTQPKTAGMSWFISGAIVLAGLYLVTNKKNIKGK